jgi:hypothetical protein
LIKIEAEQFHVLEPGGYTAICTALDNTWYHLTIEFECTAGGYKGLAQYDLHIYINGTHYGDYDFRNNQADVEQLRLNTTTAQSGYYAYWDAIGYSWDTDYTIGDNIYWKNLKDQDSAFENDALYLETTSISFVDTDPGTDANCHVKLVPSFDEHKKVLEGYDNNAGGNFTWRANFASPQTTGMFEFWVKVSDATFGTSISIQDSANATAIQLLIDAEFLQYRDSGAVWNNIVAISDNTWYHIRIAFRCNGASAYLGLSEDNFFIWVNNVQYGEYEFRLSKNDCDWIDVYSYNADSGYYAWFDAFSYSWTSGNEIADNRTLEYHIHSYDDITSNIEKCIVEDKEYEGSKAFLIDDTQLTLNELHLTQIYDENSDLRFEGNLKRVDNPTIQNQYPLVSLNNDELNEENSYTASSAEDVNASLLAIHTNVSQKDGRLIYYTEDDPAGNLTPNFRNKPKKMEARWFAIHGGKVAIFQPSGKFCLDDDRNPEAGAATITSTSGEIMSQPLISNAKHQINYVEVRGAIDPDTGTPFSGTSEDTDAQADGTGIKRYYKRFRELQSDTDCSNRATQIRTGTGFEPYIIEVELLGVYANPGEIINFAYSPLSFSATNCFVESVTHNLGQRISKYRLNTGIFDILAMNTPGYTYADETADDMAETLYTTDINSISLILKPGSGATDDIYGGVLTNDNGETAGCNFFLSDKVDVARDIIIDFSYFVNSGVANHSITTTAIYREADCTAAAGTTIWNTTEDLPCSTTNRASHFHKTISGGTIAADSYILVIITHNEVAPASITWWSPTVRYYLRRDLS